MRILSADDVRRVFTMTDALAVVEAAASIHVLGRADTPPRHQLATTEPAGELLVMPSVVGGSRFGVKVWHRFAESIGTIPGSSASILLLDPERGEEVLLDGEVITDLRTGAMTGVAARYLAAPGASEVAVIGSGIQARTQILALAEVLPTVRRVRVFSRNRSRLEAFVAMMRAEVLEAGVRVEATASAEEAVVGADVVVAATTSSTPVIADAWIASGALVCGVGSHDRHSSELEPATVARAEVLAVDTLRGGVDGAADISGPIESGLVDRSAVAELGDVVRGAAAGRRTPEGIAVFKSVGFAACDVMAAAEVARRAAELGEGLVLDLHAPSEPSQT
ncbi:ornithine cyclodeaminase family protein [Nocardioides hungaricus]